MQRTARPDGLDLRSAQINRSQSMSSDQHSLSGRLILSPPPTVNPQPAYIAASAASQIVTSDLQARSSDWSDALVSLSSLTLVNRFLDYLLYNFLSTARSTQLASLRPAVAEVLTRKLAREAITGADEELREYLGEDEDEELSAFHGGQEPRGEFDLELAWKLARLRCMVYTRLGDMEEDEEDEYIEREQLDEGGGGPRRFSSHIGNVTPAAAIFLTSVLEFLGEHALLVAGDEAQTRFSARSQADRESVADATSAQAERMVVEECDMHKVGQNSTLGRLWRTWRNRVRSPSNSISRPMSRESVLRRGHSSNFATSSRKSSIGTMDDPFDRGMSHRPSVAEVLQEEDPSLIPLPVTENDVNEIEVPGLAPDDDDETVRAESPLNQKKLRPQSMMIMPSAANPPTPTSPQRSLQTAKSPSVLKTISQTRPRSLPTAVQTPYASPAGENSVDSDFVTPREVEDPMEKTEDVVEHEENGEVTPVAEDGVHDKGRGSKGIVGGVVAGAAGAMAAGTSVVPEKFRGSKQEEMKGMSDSPAHPSASQEPHMTESLGETVLPGIVSDAQKPSGAHSSTVMDAPEPLQTKRKSGVQALPENLETSKIKEQENRRSIPTAEDEVVQQARDWKPLPIPGSTQGVADSEDLALSSADEETSEAQVPKLDSQGKRPVGFVLGTPPIPRNSRIAETSVQPREETSRDATAVALNPEVGNESGAPPLTPLREMVEAARDTSDEASSVAPSNRKSDSVNALSAERAASGQSRRSDSHSSKHSHAKHSSAGSKFAELKNQAAASQTPSGPERAAVQRVTPPPLTPLTPRETNGVGAYRSESIGSTKDKRPIHTSGSATSQVSSKLKGPVGWPNGDSDKQPLPLRTSSNDSGSSHGGLVRETDDKLESLEKLIKSEETLHYTLTPQNMREMEAPDSPRWGPPRPDTADLADFLQNTAPPGEEPARPTTSRSVASVKGVNGLRANPPDVAQRPATSSAATPTQRSKSVDLQAVASIGKTKPDAGTPREATVEKESLRDLADFIRSTGPDRAQQLPGSISSRPGTSVDATPKTMLASPGRTLAGSPTAPKHKVMGSKGGSVPKQSGSNIRLQARDAVIPRGEQSSDLIDFIREGPPRDPRDGTHRIPRTVAPFRTTMDSDELQALGPASKDKDVITRSSVASTQDSSIIAKSMHSSTNSRTGLLDATNRINSKLYNPSPPSDATFPGRSNPEEDVGPVRKQRRVRDPYAIDSDSDEDPDELRPTPKGKPKAQEESLIDFLRNVAPPSEAAAPQPLAVNAARIATGGKPVQRKDAAPTMKDRLMRNTSLRAANRTSSSRGPIPPPKAGSSTLNNGAGAPQPSTYRRPVSPHLTQSGSRFDSYRPTQPTYASHVERQRQRQKPKPAQQQARSGRALGETGDLADFLKNSGPPSTSQTYAPSVEKEGSGFSKMFSRRKKQAGTNA